MREKEEKEKAMEEIKRLQEEVAVDKNERIEFD